MSELEMMVEEMINRSIDGLTPEQFAQAKEMVRRIILSYEIVDALVDEVGMDRAEQILLEK